MDIVLIIALITFIATLIGFYRLLKDILNDWLKAIKGCKKVLHNHYFGFWS